jgi:hypothetical protein
MRSAADRTRRRRPGGLTIAAALIGGALIGTAGSGAVQACSLALAPELDDLRPGEPAGEFDPSAVTGVYEYETIARSPGLTGDRSVTIVTRFWGDAPDDVGLRVVTPGCGRTVSDTGTVGYWWVSSSERRFRSSMTLADTSGALTADQESVLVERFGPPTVLDVSRVDRTLASARAWQWELVTLAIVGGVGLLTVVRPGRESGNGDEPPERDPIRGSDRPTSRFRGRGVDAGWTFPPRPRRR